MSNYIKPILMIVGPTWKGKDPKVGGSIVVSSSKALHKKILKMLKPVA